MPVAQPPLTPRCFLGKHFTVDTEVLEPGAVAPLLKYPADVRNFLVDLCAPLLQELYRISNPRDRVDLGVPCDAVNDESSFQSEVGCLILEVVSAATRPSTSEKEDYGGAFVFFSPIGRKVDVHCQFSFGCSFVDVVMCQNSDHRRGLSLLELCSARMRGKRDALSAAKLNVTVLEVW